MASQTSSDASYAYSCRNKICLIVLGILVSRKIIHSENFSYHPHKTNVAGAVKHVTNDEVDAADDHVVKIVVLTM